MTMTKNDKVTSRSAKSVRCNPAEPTRRVEAQTLCFGPEQKNESNYKCKPRKP